MPETSRTSEAMMAVSNAMVRLHKEQFGRGPVKARSDYAGPNTIVCKLEDALLPAEKRMVRMGQQSAVRESRGAFQAATRDQFVAAVEQIVYRKVEAFAGAVDVETATVFEIFALEPVGSEDGRQ